MQGTKCFTICFKRGRVQRQLQKGRDILQGILASTIPCNIKKSWVLTSPLNFINPLNFGCCDSRFCLLPTYSFSSYKLLCADNLCTDLDWTDSSKGCTYVNREAWVCVASKPRICSLHISKTTSNAFTAILDIITTQRHNLLGVSL